MEKLTSILGVVDRPEAGGVILEKAMAVARRFGVSVELVVGDPVHRRALGIMCSKLGYHEVTLQEANLAAEPLDQIILKWVEMTGADLVIKAPSGAHPMRRWTFEANDWQLANECPAPVLLVQDKSWSAPPRFAAAVDVANQDNIHIARAILHAAGFLALGCHANLDILYCEREQRDEALRTERFVKLAQLVREFHVGCERIQVLNGLPKDVLPSLAATREYDVLVLGAQTHQSGLNAIFHSMTSRMVEATSGDVLLVRSTARTNIASLPDDLSAAQQSPDEAYQLI